DFFSLVHDIGAFDEKLGGGLLKIGKVLSLELRAAPARDGLVFREDLHEYKGAVQEQSLGKAIDDLVVQIPDRYAQTDLRELCRVVQAVSQVGVDSSDIAEDDDAGKCHQEHRHDADKRIGKPFADAFVFRGENACRGGFHWRIPIRADLDAPDIFRVGGHSNCAGSI